ncbi:MAG TPA: right-handed parallel beta-helix repeat-containing protein [Candidatus Binatus sp.]|uniref:right-handed parallel beta-helix repeat-containing protein n=1 Tax=Candidatus Binatus sp. TaxID=2811406 RepID=UPI002F4182DB
MSLERGFRGYALATLGALALFFAASPARADTAVSACGTLSPAGNYFLTTNLTATGNCIVIGSEGVSFDMRNHTITGNGTGDGISDGGGHFESMAIANGKIRNFSVGIGLDTSCCVVIRNVDSSKNTDTGVLVGTCCGVLDSVTANNNGTVGVMALECCYSLNNLQVNNNGAGGGIIATGCCTASANSTVSHNGGTGVFGNDCCNFVINSKVQQNTGDGVDLITSCCNFVVGSTVALNQGDGVHLTNDDNLVSGTNASGNSGNGIFLSGTDNQITSSVANGNQGAGADVQCPGAITGLQAKGNAGGSLTTSGGTCTQLNNKL